MPNMSYCRWENTWRDLKDCHEVLHDVEDLSDTERQARENLIELCHRIVEETEEIED